jgi:hypothetical protein
MKINIPENCIIINGTIYEAVHDESPECEGCVFCNNNTCYGNSPCTSIFSDWQIKFKRVSPLIDD